MKKINSSKKLKLIIFLIICISFAPNAFASTEIVDAKDIPQSKNYIRTVNNLLVDKRLLTSTEFDLRTQIEIPVKNQKSTQDCWAFASNTALETNLLLRNKQKYDFSERHMVYSTAKTFTDGTNPLGHNRIPSGGGNGNIAMAYYTSGRGPVLETDMPFSEDESNISLSQIANKTVQKEITDYIIFPSIIKTKNDNGDIVCTDSNKTTTYTESEVNTIRNNIKNHIMSYGAVITMTLSGSGYNDYYNYNLDYPAYYCDNPEYVPNHQIAIIGWDDNYSVENFNEAHRPKNPGAYLILNSYGTTTYKYGCYYISYEDCFVECGAMGILNVEDINYDNIYQYDPLGLSTNICLDEEQILYGANVFTKDKTSIEKLTEISISSSLEQDFELYINPNDGELSAGKLQKIEIAEKTLRSGYTTIKLNIPIELKREKFAVAVKYIGKNQKAYIGIEAPNVLYWATATSNKGESYYSQDGDKWEDIVDQGIRNANICIKAFTNVIGYNIISDSYEIEKELIYKVSPKTNTESFKKNIQTSGTIKILRNDIELQDSDIITTNTAVKVGDYKTYKVIVSGDITGTGTITSTDISQLKLYLVGNILLDEIEQKAADLNSTGDVTLTDLSQMKSAIVGLINL